MAEAMAALRGVILRRKTMRLLWIATEEAVEGIETLDKMKPRLEMGEGGLFVVI